MVRNVVVGAVVATAVLVVGPAAAQARDGSGHARPITEVVGGQVAPDGMFPWMVRLSMGCGGALTAPQVVLTAGHCVDRTGPNENITVTAGVTDLDSPKALTAHSVQVIRAAGFEDETKGDDWALIQLDHPLDLPTLPLVQGPGDHGLFTVMGWGQLGENSMKQEHVLRYANVPSVPDQKCAEEYKKAGVNLVRGQSICAGKAGIDTCQGDSGGPMIGRDNTGQWVQVGIVSWGLGCARDGYPGVYSQISAFRKVIRQATRKLS